MLDFREPIDVAELVGLIYCKIGLHVHRCQRGKACAIASSLSRLKEDKQWG